MSKKRNKNKINHANKWTANKREVRKGLSDVKKITYDYQAVCGAGVRMAKILSEILAGVKVDARTPEFIKGCRTVTANVKVIRVAVTALTDARTKIENTKIPAALVGDVYDDALLDVIEQLGQVNEIGSHVSDSFIGIADAVTELCEFILKEEVALSPEVLAKINEVKELRDQTPTVEKK